MQTQRKENVVKPSTGHKVGNVANANVVGGIPVVFVYDIADAATADYDITTTHKVEIYDVVVQKRGNAGGAANTVRIKNAGNNLSDAISINIADTTLARAATIDDAQSTVSAGGTIRIAVTKAGGNAACFVTIHAVRRA